MESLLYGRGWEGLLDDSLLIKVARAHCVGNGWGLARGTVASAPCGLRLRIWSVLTLLPQQETTTWVPSTTEFSSQGFEF